MKYELYYKYWAAIVVAYDVTDRRTFDAVEETLERIWLSAPSNCVVMLCGNKIDLISKRVVTTEEGMGKAELYGLYFVETSATDGTNVNELFELATCEVRYRIDNKEKQFNSLTKIVQLSYNNNQWF